MTSTLFYLELNEILIDQITIFRGIGLPEITIVDAVKTEFFNSLITQGN